MSDFMFNIDMPLEIHKEDAPSIAEEITQNSEDTTTKSISSGFMIICDGAGGTGSSKHKNVVFENKTDTFTSAYLASRLVSKSAHSFLVKNSNNILKFAEQDNTKDIKSMVEEMGNSIRTTLDNFVNEQKLFLLNSGSTLKMLPSTLTSIIYNHYPEGTVAVVISVGDSWALMLDQNGLHQLSKEDITYGNAMTNSSNAGTLVSQNCDFHLNIAVYKNLPSKCMIFATSDGLTDRLKPLYRLENNLISFLAHSSNWNKDSIEAQLKQLIEKSRCNKSDDCSIAGAMLGFESIDDFQDCVTQRFDVLGGRGKNNTILGKYFQIQDVKMKHCTELDNLRKENDIKSNEFRNEVRKQLPKLADMINDAQIGNFVRSVIPEFDNIVNRELNTKIEEKNRILSKQLSDLHNELFIKYSSLVRNAFIETYRTWITRSAKDKVINRKTFYPIELDPRLDIWKAVKDCFSYESINRYDIDNIKREFIDIENNLERSDIIKRGERFCENLSSFLKNYSKKFQAEKYLDNFFKSDIVYGIFMEELEQNFFQLFEWKANTIIIGREMNDQYTEFENSYLHYKQTKINKTEDIASEINHAKKEIEKNTIMRFSSKLIESIMKNAEIAQRICDIPFPDFEQKIVELQAIIDAQDFKLEEISKYYLLEYELFKKTDFSDAVQFAVNKK